MTSVTPAEDSDRLRSELLELVVEVTADHFRIHARNGLLPASFGGHRVEADATADAITTLGLLHRCGVEDLNGRSIVEMLRTLLRHVDGPATHTFFSYRIAETVQAFGPWDDNALLGPLSDSERRQVELACDSSDWIDLLDDAVLPRNYAAVLARCEHARAQLGLPTDTARLDGLIERLRALLEANPRGYLDDSNHRIGRYDIYTADIWLFTEPLAPRLGDVWSRGLRAAYALTDSVAADDGTAISWGRSIGALSLALTVELAAHAPTHDPDRAGVWTARALAATRNLRSWFSEGAIDAHRHRSPYGYRGTFRRLQMTFDILGKLAWAAALLGELDGPVTADPSGLRRRHDRLVTFDDERPASVWSARGDGPGIVVPFVGASRSDYLAAPRAPGVFEVPVDSELACWVPMVTGPLQRLAPSGVPLEVRHGNGAVTARWDGLRGDFELDPEPGAPASPGDVQVTWELAGRGVRGRWDLRLDAAPPALGLMVPELVGRPLRVEVRPHWPTTASVDRVVVDGIAEWRSFTGEFAAVHEIRVEPAPTTSLTVTVTPKLRVATTERHHHYHRQLAAAIDDDVVLVASPWGPLGDRHTDPETVDVFHLHWPEWMAFDDLAEHRRIAEDLMRRRIPVVWTAHNLTPHERRPDVYDPIYQLWADTADAVIHHSYWGRDQFLHRYGAGRARHVVVPHGHFGEVWADELTDRAAAERALGLTPAPLRIGLMGAPRADKLVGEFLEGVHRSHRHDLQVACWSLDADDPVPDDPRIAIAEPYAMCDETTYALRLSACDAIALPFRPDGDMLGTGTVFDAVGVGLVSLTSDWGFLTEMLGDAGIVVGHRADDIAAALNALDDERLAAARAATLARREHVLWSDIGARTVEVFEEAIRSTRPG